MELFNPGLLRVPTNWLIVLVTVVLGLFALHFSLSLIHGMQGQAASKQPGRAQ